MSSSDIRNWINLVESEETDSRKVVLDIIERLYKMMHEHADASELSSTITELAHSITAIDDGSRGTAYTNRIATTGDTLKSLVRQMFNDPHAVKTSEEPYNAIKNVLRQVYRDIISNDTSYDELAKTNVEAADKIKRLAALINNGTVDKNIRQKSKQIYQQASVIR